MPTFTSVSPSLIPVAQYLRVSTEDQKYSTSVQAATIGQYAVANGFVVTRTFQDEARSGLTLSGRPALQELLETVAKGACGFTKVLVLDVSRWGRFLNTDESAYYDFHCRLHGVQVIYVAEPYINDSSPFATAFKALKRAAAAEYSRELSNKVRAGQADLVRRGFFVSAPLPYGMRKLVVNERLEPRMQLEIGDRKGLQSHHNLLVHGPSDEVALVKRIFSLYARTDLTIGGIASLLRREGLRNHYGQPFTNNRVAGILRQEAYLGRNIWGRRQWILGGRSSTAVDKSMWIQKDDCFPPIVSARTFAKVKAKAARLGRQPKANIQILLSDLAEGLRRGVQYTHSDLGVHTTYGLTPYQKIFGGITHAYALLGIDDSAWAESFERSYETRQGNLPVRQRVVDDLQALGFPTKALRFSSGVVVDGKLTVRVCTAMQRGLHQDKWLLSAKMNHGPTDLIIVIRISLERMIRDYLVILPNGTTELPTWLSPRTFSRLHESVESDLSCLQFYVESLQDMIRAEREGDSTQEAA